MQKQDDTWVMTLKESWNPTQRDYAVESPFPCWPRWVLASAHINKLMIIVKREDHTHNNQTSKVYARVENGLSYNYMHFHNPRCICQL